MYLLIYFVTVMRWAADTVLLLCDLKRLDMIYILRLLMYMLLYCLLLLHCRNEAHEQILERLAPLRPVGLPVGRPAVVATAHRRLRDRGPRQGD